MRLPNGSEIWLCGLDDAERTGTVLVWNLPPSTSTNAARSRTKACSWRARAWRRRPHSRRGHTTTRTHPARGTGPRLCSFTRRTRHRGPPRLHSQTQRTTYRCCSIPWATGTTCRPNSSSNWRAPERQKRRFWLGQFTAELDNALWTPEVSGTSPAIRSSSPKSASAWWLRLIRRGGRCCRQAVR